MPAMVTDLFPVSAMWDPPFDIMVLLLGEDGEGSTTRARVCSYQNEGCLTCL